MGDTISELIKRVYLLTEEQISKAIVAIDEIIEEDSKDDPKITSCPHCGCTSLVRNGVKSGKQRYKCKSCGVTSVYTTHTSLQNSHFGEAVWKHVIRDTIDGNSLDDTAEALGFSHTTAFNFRHKILSALETFEAQNPTVLHGVCELDDTYVLESYKGTNLPEDFWREARAHGAVAQKRGISSEYVSVQAGVMRDGKIYTKSVNRATPSADDVRKAFDGHLTDQALVLCDGAKSYNALASTCEVKTVNKDEPGEFSHINNVNGYHSFIKQRYVDYRGVATKYLNRYNALFSRAYASAKSAVDAIYSILSSNNYTLHRKVDDLTVDGLLEL